MKAVENIGFETVAPGHGGVGTKADFSAYRQYVEDLKAAVSEGIAAGQTVEQLQASNILEQYKGLENYEQARNQNIAQAYQLLQAGRT